MSRRATFLIRQLPSKAPSLCGTFLIRQVRPVEMGALLGDAVELPTCAVRQQQQHHHHHQQQQQQQQRAHRHRVACHVSHDNNSGVRAASPRGWASAHLGASISARSRRVDSARCASRGSTLRSRAFSPSCAITRSTPTACGDGPIRRAPCAATCRRHLIRTDFGTYFGTCRHV